MIDTTVMKELIVFVVVKLNFSREMIANVFIVVKLKLWSWEILFDK